MGRTRPEAKSNAGSRGITGEVFPRDSGSRDEAFVRAVYLQEIGQQRSELLDSRRFVPSRKIRNARQCFLAAEKRSWIVYSWELGRRRCYGMRV